MKKLFLVLPFIVFLAACSHQEPVVVTSSLPCQPPAALMQKVTPLSFLAGNSLPESGAISKWVEDIGQYNLVGNEKNELIDWILQNCQK